MPTAVHWLCTCTLHSDKVFNFCTYLYISCYCFLIFLQRLFMLEDQEVILGKMEDPENAVEFRDATLAWNKAQPPPAKRSKPQPSQKNGGMHRVFRREKLSLYINIDDEKANGHDPNPEHLLTHIEQESPQSTIFSTQSIRPPLHKTLHHIQLTVCKVPPISHTYISFTFQLLSTDVLSWI